MISKRVEQEELEQGAILQPKNDVVFQALFTRGKETITKAFLEDVLKIKIHRLDLDKSKDLLNDNKIDKNGRLDLRAIINDNVECDIEIQLVPHEKMLERFLYYWSKMYTANVQVGHKYSELRKTISIIIVDKEINELKDIKKAHTTWHIREDEYTENVLTPYLQFDIIELRKAIEEYKENKDDEVLQWMMFFENPEDAEVKRIMENNEDIKEAKEELDEISRNDILRRMALKAEIERMDQEQRMYEARRDGRKEGKKEGIKEGKREANLETAKKLLDEKIDIDIIIKATGLTKEEILNINKK